jgi:DNA-3-methyladenine glycosylase II
MRVVIDARAGRLDETSLRVAAEALAGRDDDLAGILARHGPPPLWAREPGFATLVAIILEQQVSLASGAAALERLRRAAGGRAAGGRAAGGLVAGSVAALGMEGAQAAGLTRQKARYVVTLAESVVEGSFDPTALDELDDDAARSALIGVLGVGRWTADIYLLMALLRPDVWPDGDLALTTALRRAKGLAGLPDRERQRTIAETWRPWRAVAARLLWHAYLAGER